ncbi:MAG: EAL domain-containing protein, partial [Burkholderiaceae bacterium]|nr:EAL domain-containing protein [Burkholderiaceae bacterium]
VNAAGQVLAANAAAREFAGARADGVVGRHVSELVTWRSARAAARRWSRLWERLRRGRAALRTVLVLADGRRLAVEIDADVMRVDGENAACLLVRDISAARATAREQQRALARARLLAHPPDGGAWLLGADRRVIEARVSPEHWPDLHAPEALGIPFDLLLAEEAGAELRAIVEQFVAGAGAQTRTGLWRLRSAHTDGRPRWLAVRLSNRLQDPRVRAIAVVANDASEAVATQGRLAVLQQRLLAFAVHAADVVAVLDASGVIRYQSPAITRTTGVSPQATLGLRAASLVSDEDRPAVEAAILAAGQADAGSAATRRVRLRAGDGTTRPCLLTVRNCQSVPGIGGLLLTATLMPDGAAPAEEDGGCVEPALLRQARRADFRERLLDLAIHARGDFTQSLTHTLRLCTETLGAASASFWRLQREPLELRCEAHYENARERLAREWIGAALSATAFPDYFARLRERQPVVIPDVLAAPLLQTASGEARGAPARATVDAPVLLDGELQGVLRVQDRQPRAWDDDEVDFVTTAALLIALAMEAAQRQEAELRIEQLAWYDSLTGLPNRNLLRETMRDMLMTAANRDRRVAVMLIDLDRFKDVNDTLGHVVGDALIKSAAAVLKEAVGEAGMVARLGGDEFVVLLDRFEHRQEVALLAARIAQALHRTDLVPNVDTQVSASIGVALFPEHGREISTLLKNADAAMYQAKRDGRNQFSFFNPIRAERAAREVQLGIQLLKALQGEAGQFVVEYQPQVEMATGRVVGLEALIRWRHPTYGLLTPDRFIGVAEVSGLSERITRWVINEVCAQILRWREQRPGFDIPISINVAGRELGSSVLPLIVRSALAKHAIEPRMITLEITERTLVRENEINNDVMAELASLGVGLVLDDFGTGYSMLGYLKRMPISALKIDQSFVAGLPRDADSCAIVHAMLAVARHFRLKVIAEGIEAAEQVEYLRSIGCDYAQGYFYSRPLASDGVVEHIELPPAPPHGVPGGD